jgi:hypothetical protein
MIFNSALLVNPLLRLTLLEYPFIDALADKLAVFSMVVYQRTVGGEAVDGIQLSVINLSYHFTPHLDCQLLSAVWVTISVKFGALQGSRRSTTELSKAGLQVKCIWLYPGVQLS